MKLQWQVKDSKMQIDLFGSVSAVDAGVKDHDRKGVQERLWPLAR